MGQTPQPYDDATRVSLQQRIDEVCLRFERAWKSGQRPVLEEYLGDAAEPERTLLCRQLLALELAYRHPAGGLEPLEPYNAARFLLKCIAVMEIWPESLRLKATGKTACGGSIGV